jgi:phage terminase small subunit
MPTEEEELKISKKQKLFCDTYLSNGFNVLQAYRKVYNDTTTEHPSYPYRLIKQRNIQEYIEKRRTEIYDSLYIDSKRVMSEIAMLAFQEKDEKNQAIKLKALELLSKNLNIA